MENTIRLVGISGSLRHTSHNTSTLRAVKEVLPENVEYEILDLAHVPFYNQDVESVGIPEAVQQLVDQLAQADAIVVASPEYNGMIPGVLKNALDWFSRPSVRAAIDGKPVGLIGASLSPNAAARANKQLFTLLTNMRTAPQEGSEVLVGEATAKFSPDGKLIDAEILSKLQKLVEKLVEAVEAKNTVEVAA